MRRALTISPGLLTIPATSGVAAAAPWRWRLTGTTTLPLTSFRGVAHGTGGSWLFDGIELGCESERLDVFDGSGGVLHWLIEPITTNGRTPTYSPGKSTLLHFVPAGNRH